MNNSWLLFFSTLLIIFIVLVESIRFRHYKKTDYLTGVSIIFAFCYGVVPIFIYLRSLQNNTTNIVLQKLNESDHILIGLLSTLIGYICVVLGYHIVDIIKETHSNRAKVIKSNDVDKRDEIFIKFLAYFTLFIGLLSLAKYIGSLGGVIEAIKMADYYRRYTTDTKYTATYSVMLMPLIIASCYLFFILYHQNKKQKNKINFSLFILTFLLSLYYFGLNAGRLPLFVFIVTFLVYSIRGSVVKKILISSISIAIGILILAKLDQLFAYLSYGTIANSHSADNSMFDSFITEFSFPFVNISKVYRFTLDNGSFRYFLDLITWVVNVIPTNILNIVGLTKLTSSHVINTTNYGLIGIGGVPVDIVTLGYYQFSLGGVVLICSLFGVVVKFLDILTKQFNEGSLKIIRIKTFFLLIFTVMYADPDVIARGRFDYTILIGLICIIWWRKKRKQRLVKLSNFKKMERLVK